MMLTQRLSAVALIWLVAGCLPELDENGGGGSACGVRGAPPNVEPWPNEATGFEDRVLELTNQRRAAGGCCGDQGCFNPSAPLTSNPNLRAAARLHARDMGERGYFAHETPEGVAPLQRVRSAGFDGCAVGENIAAGYQSAEAVVEGWMTSPGHCVNLLSRGFRELGVGYYRAAARDPEHLWVQNFGG